MSEILQFLENGVHVFARLGINLAEISGILIVIWTSIRALLGYFRHEERLRLMLAQGIALALEFKLGGEVLRTVVVREWTELLILGAVVALRAVLTLLIHWEMRAE